MITENEKLVLSIEIEPKVIFDSPSSKTLQMAFWLHNYDKLNNNPLLQSVKRIHERIEIRIKQIKSEIQLFTIHEDKTIELSKIIRDLINSRRR